MTAIEKWKKRLLKRTQTLYLFDTQVIEYFDRWVGDKRITKMGTRYFVLWLESRGGRLCFGSLEDGMMTRYGVNTIGAHQSDHPRDWYNGDAINDEVAAEMTKIRQGISTLPTFDIDTLKDLKL